MFEIFRAQSGGYFWHLKAANGEKLCHSEVYSSKQAARSGEAHRADRPCLRSQLTARMTS